MGAVKINPYQVKVSIEYRLQDGKGNEFTIGVTASVEDNGPEYPPTVLVQSVSWDTKGPGAFEKLCDFNSLPDRMQAAIWQMAVEEAYKTA